MSGPVEEAHENIGKVLPSESIKTQGYTQRSRKVKPHGKSPSSRMSKKKLADLLTNSKKRDIRRRNASYKAAESSSTPSLVSCQNQEGQLSAIGSDEDAKCEKGDLISENIKRRRKRKRKRRTNNKLVVDEASKLQRQTRYLLIKMKMQQNLLDAYSTEGWKGQSREKIKPERELQRAKKQILKCKLGLRDALRQLELLSSDGCIDESAIALDGSVHHDNIHCAKCKLREAFPDNDIILCDGTCNCAFHQMCIDPPLLTENIPPGDQCWYCKYCVCKIEIIDAMNAHLGTSYPNDSNWQDIFKVEATLPDGGDTLLNQEEWPSEDSGDDDYDPDRVEQHDNSCSNSRVCSEGESSNDDSSSSYSLQSLDDEVFDDESRKLSSKMGLESTSADFNGLGSGSGSGSDCEFVSGRRQRRSVDYRKLYDEMFGKDALANEQVSEDEDWGPSNRKRREKESDAATTLMTLCETEDKNVKDIADSAKVDTHVIGKETKRSFFRIPAEAVEKLRLVFANNQLPSRAVKEDLSKHLGLDPQKVSKWFKNARYLSLKTKKGGEDNPAHNDGPLVSKESKSGHSKNEAIDKIVTEGMPTNVAHTPKEGCATKLCRRKNPGSPTGNAKQQLDHDELHLLTSTNKVDGEVDHGKVDMGLIKPKRSANEEKNKADDIIGKSESDDQQATAAEAQMEKLCLLKTKLENLQQVILVRAPNRKAKMTPPSTAPGDTILVPIPHLMEKP